MNPISYAEEKQEGLRILSKRDIIDMYQNIHIIEGKKEKSFINMWMDDINIRTYDHIDFLPKQQTPNNVYNSFKHFEAETKEPHPEIDINQTCLMNHMHRLCNNDEPTLKYFLDCI